MASNEAPEVHVACASVAHVFEPKEHINSLVEVEQGLVAILGKVGVVANGKDLSHLVEVYIERIHFPVRLGESFHQVNLHLDLGKLLAQVLSVLELANLRDVQFDLARKLYDWLRYPDAKPIHNDCE